MLFVIVFFVLIEQKTNVKTPKTPASVPDMFILIGVGELKCIIEVSIFLNCTTT